MLDDQLAARYASRPRGAALYAVVATMGRGDEDAVERLLAARADYLGVVVSPKRMGQVREYLAARGVCGSRIEKVRGPAGLDIGAERPEEVAISILAEIVALARAGSGAAEENAATPAGSTATATDPVCGMTVPADGSRPSSTYEGQTVHFCCPGAARASRRIRRRMCSEPGRGGDVGVDAAAPSCREESVRGAAAG